MAKYTNSLFSSIKTILSLKPDKEAENRLIEKGVPTDEINNGTVIMETLIKKASDGEISAIKEVLSMMKNDNESDESSLSILYKVLDKDEN